VIGRRATVDVVAMLTGLLALAIVFSPPSQAESKQLLVSSSAAGPFRDHLAMPLFAGTGPFVPHDEASRTFYVLNNSQQVARTTVAVVNRAASGDLEDALTFEVDIEGTTTSGALPGPGAEKCDLVATGPNLQPGDRQAVAISLAVADLEGQVGMNEAASLDFVVTLTHAGADGHVEVCGEQAGAGSEAGAEPDVPAEHCQRDVVVTAVGDPTCAPTAIAAGTSYGGSEPRHPAVAAGLAGVLITTGAGLVLWAGRRRRDAVV